jgi:hypothetical protein
MNKTLIVNKESAIKNDECYISTTEKNNKKLFDLQFLPSIYEKNKKPRHRELAGFFCWKKFKYTKLKIY